MDNNESGGNGFGVVWEEEEAHVMVDSRAASGIMGKQQGYCCPSLYIPKPFRETKALRCILRFFPYGMLLGWVAEVTRRGRNKYNKPCGTFLSYDREFTLGMLLRVFRCFMYMLLNLGHSRKLFWQVIDVD